MMSTIMIYHWIIKYVDSNPPKIRIFVSKMETFSSISDVQYLMTYNIAFLNSINCSNTINESNYRSMSMHILYLIHPMYYDHHMLKDVIHRMGMHELYLFIINYHYYNKSFSCSRFFPIIVNNIICII